MAEEQTTTLSGRVLFSTYDAGDDFSWSARWKRPDARPVTMCRSQRDSARATHAVMQEFWKDPRVEAILIDVMSRHGEL